jgi:MYXO-CTERM domain-containing protein
LIRAFFAPLIYHSEKVFTMKRILSALAIAAASLFATSAAVAAPVVTAGTLTLNSFEHAGAPGGTVFGFSIPVSAGIGGLLATFDDGFFPTQTVVYCVDLFSAANPFGTTAQYDKIDYVQADFGLALEPANINALSKLFTFNAGVTNLDAATSAGMQLAVWELLYDGEGGSLSTGNFNAGSAPVAAKAWATTLLAGAATSTADYSISLFADEAYTFKPTHQNFITATFNSGGSCDLGNNCVVSTAGSLPLVLLGLGAAGFVSTRRRKA